MATQKEEESAYNSKINVSIYERSKNLRIVSWQRINLGLSSIFSANCPITSFEADGRSYSILCLARFLPMNSFPHTETMEGRIPRGPTLSLTKDRLATVD